MNWISTAIPSWREECENHRRRHEPFELRDVTTSEQLQFIATFSNCFHLRIKQNGRSMLIEEESETNAGV
jgi:hypothetical protein